MTVLQRAFFPLALILAFGGFTRELAGIDPKMAVSLDEGSPFAQLTMGTIYVVGLLSFVRSEQFPYMIRKVWPVFMLPILAIASSVWSPDPGLTLRRAFALLGSVTFGLSVASVYGYKESLRLLIRSLVFGVLLSIIWAIALPNLGVHQAWDAVEPIHAGKWRGIFAHKNALGGFAALTSALLVLYGGWALNSALLRLGALAASLLVLVMANSSTGFVLAGFVTLVGLSTYLVVLTPRRYRVNALFLIALLMCISSFVFQQAEDLLLDVLGKDPDLTGRTEYWNYILSSMADYWVIGHGYFAGFLRIAGDIEDIMGANFGSTHNGYLDIFVSFGLLGLFVAIGYLTWLLLGCIRLILVATPEFGRLATFPICAFTFVVQHSLVESGILAGNSIFPLLLALASGMIVRANTLIQTRDKNNYFGYPIQSAKVTAHYAATQHESGRKAEISRLPLHLN